MALRFALAGATILAFAAAARRLRFGAREHARASRCRARSCTACPGGVRLRLPRRAARGVGAGGGGLLGLAADRLAGARAAFGSPLSARFLAGGLVGLLGVTLIFWPEIARAPAGGGTGAGRAVHHRRGAAVGGGQPLGEPQPPPPPALLAGAGLGMLCAAGQHARCSRWRWAAPSCCRATPPGGSRCCTPALAGSVLTFACYLTLQDRLGPGRGRHHRRDDAAAGAVVSLLFEGYRPEPLTFAGAALALAGNVAMLGRRSPPPRIRASPRNHRKSPMSLSAASWACPTSASPPSSTPSPKPASPPRTTRSAPSSPTSAWSSCPTRGSMRCRPSSSPSAWCRRSSSSSTSRAWWPARAKGEGLGNQFPRPHPRDRCDRQRGALLRGRERHPRGRQGRPDRRHRGDPDRAVPGRHDHGGEVAGALHQGRQGRRRRQGGAAPWSTCSTKCQAALNEGKPVRSLDFSKEEQAVLKPLCLITAKPAMFVGNVDEHGFENNPLLDKLRATRPRRRRRWWRSAPRPRPSSPT